MMSGKGMEKGKGKSGFLLGLRIGAGEVEEISAEFYAVLSWLSRCRWLLALYLPRRERVCPYCDGCLTLSLSLSLCMPATFQIFVVSPQSICFVSFLLLRLSWVGTGWDTFDFPHDDEAAS